MHCPSRQRRQEFFGEFRKTEETSRSNLWRPTVVNRIRGSKWNQALPGRHGIRRRARRQEPMCPPPGAPRGQQPRATDSEYIRPLRAGATRPSPGPGGIGHAPRRTSGNGCCPPRGAGIDASASVGGPTGRERRAPARLWSASVVGSGHGLPVGGDGAGRRRVWCSPAPRAASSSESPRTGR